MNFENKIFEGIHYSRFIASWFRAGGNFKDFKITKGNIIKRQLCLFRDWLRSLTINGKNIPEDVIVEIVDMATSGKLELEESAKKFIKERW